MTETKPDWAAPDLDLPESCVPMGEIRVVTYLDEDGEESYGYAISEGMLRSSLIGILTYIIHLQQHRAEGDSFGDG